MVADCGRELPYLCVTNPRPSDQPAETTAPKGCQQVWGRGARGVCVHIYECVRVCARARMRVGRGVMRVWGGGGVPACVRACVRACMRVCVCVM